MTSTDPDAPTLPPQAHHGTSEAGDADTLAPTDEPTSLRASPVAMRPLRRGDGLGRYLVVDVLGRGGMGVVYAAYDPELDRRVAIKVLKWRGAGPPSTAGRTRLAREAQAMARVSHRNVVAVYDVGEIDASVFVAMEYIEGRTLAQWLAEPGDAPRPWREVLAVFMDAARGLAAAHAAGLVHRDFKPENVMVADDGRVVVLDFGLARPTEAPSVAGEAASDAHASSSALHADLTVTGSLMGTPAYMSPEQFAGRTTDARTDQFSLCVALYRAVYGRPPFPGDTLAELSTAVLREEVAPAPRGSKVPAWLRRVLLRGLSREPEHRYPTMDALLEALDRDPARRRRRVLGGLGLAAVVVGAALGGRSLSQTPDACTQLGAAVDEAWSAERRGAIESAFAREAKAFATDTWTRVSSSLDAYASGWKTARVQACESSRRGSREEASTATRRAECLDASLRHFEALTRLLGEADRETVGHAVEAVSSLTSPEACADPSTVSVFPVPDDPQLQPAVETIRRDLARVYAMVGLGEIAQGRTLALDTLARAEAAGYGPATAEVRGQLTHLLSLAGEIDDALAMADRATTDALVHGRDRVLLAALLDAALMNARYRDEHALARWQVHEARAVARRLGDEVAGANVDVAEATVLRLGAGGDALDEALAATERAYETFERHDRRVRMLDALVAMSNVQLQRGDYDATEVVLRRAEKLVDELLGPNHPQRATLAAQLSRVYSSRGEHARAVQALRQAHAIFRAVVGDGHVNTMATANGLGLELEAAGQPEEALDYAELAYALAENLFDDEHPELDIVRNNYAGLLRRLGRADEGIDLMRQSVADATHRDGADAERTLDARVLYADTLRVAGRLEEARTIYEGVVESYARPDVGEPADLAYAQAGLALTLDRLGDTEAALALSEASLASAGPMTPDAYLSRVAHFVHAYLLRRHGGDAGRVAQQAAALATAFEEDEEFGPLFDSFTRWHAGQDVVPNY